MPEINYMTAGNCIVTFMVGGSIVGASIGLGVTLKIIGNAVSSIGRGTTTSATSFLSSGQHTKYHYLCLVSRILETYICRFQINLNSKWSALFLLCEGIQFWSNNMNVNVLVMADSCSTSGIERWLFQKVKRVPRFYANAVVYWWQNLVLI